MINLMASGIRLLSLGTNHGIYWIFNELNFVSYKNESSIPYIFFAVTYPYLISEEKRFF